MDIRCFTDEESELYEKLLNEEAMETGIKLFEPKINLACQERRQDGR